MVLKLVKKVRLTKEVTCSISGKKSIIYHKECRGILFESLKDVAASMRQEAKWVFETAQSIEGSVVELEGDLLVLKSDEFEWYEGIQEFDTIPHVDNNERREHDEF